MIMFLLVITANYKKKGAKIHVMILSLIAEHQPMT